ncbi:competence/damage-inducible protein A [Gilvimarinus sp. F26214L]|uniref:competence/damage-inducible protein A n=1 Tax=Gilvimarinus sp. DZF01 TaxID=3461371 RepID=UPI0040457627
MQHIGLLIIGDEILSGKRQDKHLPRVIEMLDSRGLELAWVRILGDDGAILTENLRQTFASDSIVFSCGGIGATTDDRTRQCAAAALDLDLAVHPEGRREMQARFNETELTPQRLRLVEFPEGASIIPNPVNRVPGFSLRDHHFMPGFPSMAWPMIEWVLDNRYGNLQAPGRIGEEAINVWDARESDVIPLMERFVLEHPELRLSCLPGSIGGRFQLELGLRGAPSQVDAGMRKLRGEIEGLGFSWEPVSLVRT